MIRDARTKTVRTTEKPSVRFHSRIDCGTSKSLDSDSTTDLFRIDHEASQQHNLELAQRILKRIDAQLPGRIRHLTVYTTENAVVLAGECCTFYSKQLAQHAAMGVIEYEQLINNIEVRVTR